MGDELFPYETRRPIIHTRRAPIETPYGWSTGLRQNLGKSIVKGGIAISFGDTCFQPRMQYFKFVSLFDLVNEGARWAQASDCLQKCTDLCFIKVLVEKCTNNDRSIDRVMSDHICLDIVEHIISTQVVCQIGNKVVLVANDDQGKLIRKSGLFEEFFDSFWIVLVLTNSNFNVFDLKPVKYLPRTSP